MKKILVVLGFFLVIRFGAFSQTKEENIRTLIIMSGSGDLGMQVLDALLPQFSQMLPDVPSEYWAKFRNKIEVNELVETILPIYAKYYTDDDIKQLLNFYKSEIGQKMIKISPLMMQESMSAGQEWGKKISDELIKELVKDGYISG